jgi:hypothetical protein
MNDHMPAFPFMQGSWGSHLTSASNAAHALRAPALARSSTCGFQVLDDGGGDLVLFVIRERASHANKTEPLSEPHQDGEAQFVSFSSHGCRNANIKRTHRVMQCLAHAVISGAFRAARPKPRDLEQAGAVAVPPLHLGQSIALDRFEPVYCLVNDPWFRHSIFRYPQI